MHRKLFKCFAFENPRDPTNIFMVALINYGRLTLAALSIFLMLDSVFAIIFGKRYMLLGLNHMPEFYRALIERMSKMSPISLLFVKLAEFTVGLILLMIARGLA